MRRKTLKSIAALSCLVVLAACADSSPAGRVLAALSNQPTVAPRTAGSSATTAPTCSVTSLADLQALVDAAFGAGSPDANSVHGKIDNLQHQIDIGDVNATKAQAFNTVEFILKKNSQKPLPGGTSAVVQLVNAVFCYASLSMYITDPANSFFIYPTDLPQTLVNSTGAAGIQLDANPVSEPTLITIIPYDTTYTLGEGPLNTQLDQYPGFYHFEKFSPTGAPLAKPAVVAVCPAASVPATALPTLHLGHNASAGFEMPDRVAADFLNCAAVAQADKPAGIGDRILSFFMPRDAWAAAPMYWSGGIGGTISELSPFGTVDASVSFSGGIGGTISELLGSPIRTFRSTSLESAVPPPCEAPIGESVSVGCRPMVQLLTPRGHKLVNVPVTFTVESGGGSIGVQTSSGACALPFSSTSLVKSSSSFGRASVCWTLGSVPSPNIVRATPGVGDVLPPGVVITPTVEATSASAAAPDRGSLVFTATANDPSTFVFSSPVSGDSHVAGAPFTVKAKAYDHNGQFVSQWSKAVTLTLDHGTFAGVGPTLTANAVGGEVTFTDVTITTVGTYNAKLTATFNGASVTTTSDAFTVTPAAAYGMQIVTGNGQVAAAGSRLPVNPTVAVNDEYGNAVPGATIGWTAGGSSAGFVTPTSSVTAAGNGQAYTEWTVGAGANELYARLSLSSLRDSVLVFTATGTTPTMVSLDNCAPGGSGDPFTDPSNPFAFYIPFPQGATSIKQIQLYVSSAGKANAPSPYQLRLSIQRTTFDGAVSPPVYTTANVFLRGNNSESKMVTFVLASPLVGAPSGSGPKQDVMMRLAAITNPDGAKLSFNTGPCSPGKSCNPPSSCKATEVSNPLPYPSGTFYRKSVGINVLGN